MDVSHDFKQKVLFVAAVSVVLVTLGALFAHAATYVLIIFAGIFFAVVFSALIDWLKERLGVQRWVSFAIVWVAFAALLGVFIAFLVPMLQEQIGQVDQIVSSLESTPLIGEAVQRAQSLNLTQFLQDQAIVGRVGDAVFTITSGLFSAFVILFIAVYGSLSPRTYTQGLISIFPDERRAHVRALLSTISHTLTWWLIGQLSAMAVVATLTYIGLLALGVELALLLALIAGLLSFIPNLGPILSFIPAALVALSQGPALALYVALLYVGVQTLESYFITPFIQRWAIHLPQAALLAVQVLFGVLFGIIGVILAAPLTAAALAIQKKEKVTLPY